MADLLSSLSSAARALNAQTAGLAVVGQNIANVNTPGYARRVIDLASVAPDSARSAGNGVTVVGVHAARDLLVEIRLAQELSAEGQQAALADGLSAIDAVFGAPGESIDGDLTAFFDSFAALADDPTASSARQGVLSEAASLAESFHDLAGRLAGARADADTRLGAAVDQVNDLAERIASLNVSIGRAGGLDSTGRLQFRDEQLQAIQTLSGFLDVHTIQREDGGFDVTFGSGRPLVTGTEAVSIEAARSTDGTLVLRSLGQDVTAEATGGQIGGLRELRDVLVPGYMERLDSLAYELAGQVNALHAAGFDLDGAAGLPFFSPLAAVEGAASALTVNAALSDDPRLVAAAGIPSAGDNRTARSIAALRTARVLDGGATTFAEGFASLAYHVGQDAAVAADRRESRSGVVAGLRNLRESVSGVSIDEEAAMMLRFQRAYEANARYFQSVNAAIDILMQMVGA